MTGATVSPRYLVPAAALTAFALVAQDWRSQGGSIAAVSAPTEQLVDIRERAMEPPPPPRSYAHAIDELRAIGQGVLRATPEHPPSATWLPAAGACRRPSAAEQTQLRARIATWIDTTYAAERADALKRVELRFGCDDPAGLIIDVVADRTAKRAGVPRKLTRWWVLDVTADGIAKVAERTSTYRDDWMEWADEGMVHTLALVDVDRDGARDAVFTDTEHEGGASGSAYEVSVRLAGRATATPIVSMYGTLDASLDGSDLVLGLGRNDARAKYRCVDRALRLATCAAAKRVERTANRRELAERYAALRDVPDPDQLAEDLVTLGVPAAERARLIAVVRDAL